MRQIINIFLYIWQLPLHILALILEAILCKSSFRSIEYKGALVISVFCFGGLCLGKYIFLHVDAYRKALKHEYGHYVLSKYLGPLYLIIIGLPSLLHNVIHELCGKIGIKWDYYKFYTEKSADKLGKVYEED